MHCNNWCYSRNITGTLIPLTGFGIFRRSTMVRKFTFLYKIVNGLAPKYLANCLNFNDNQVYKTRASEHNNTKRFGTRTKNFKQSFIPFCVRKYIFIQLVLPKLPSAWKGGYLTTNLLLLLYNIYTHTYIYIYIYIYIFWEILI